MSRPVSTLLRGHRALVYVAPDTSVLEAVRKMSDENVSSLLILDGARLAGIFTERDAMRRVLCEGLAPEKTPIRDVMTPEPTVVGAKETIADVVALMDERKIRHMPVVDGEQLLGIISLRDVLRQASSNQAAEIDQLKAYVYSGHAGYPG
jgi:CBS domain-containing protein